MCRTLAQWLQFLYPRCFVSVFSINKTLLFSSSRCWMIIQENSCVYSFLLFLIMNSFVLLETSPWNRRPALQNWRWWYASLWACYLLPWWLVVASCVTAPCQSLNQLLYSTILLNHQRRWNSTNSDKNKENSVDEGPCNASRCMRFP